MNYPKFLNNKRETFKFHFDSGIEKEGKFGPQWSFGVLWKHDDNTEEETYLYATAALNRLLEGLNPLKNRTLQIEKAQDPKDLKRTYWVIYDENGVEITPRPEGQPQAPIPTENASYAKPEANNDEIAALNARLDKASAAFVKLSDEVKSLRILVEEVAGKKATDLHVALPNRDITEPKTPSLEEAAKIVDSHKEEIPVINELPKGFN